MGSIHFGEQPGNGCYTRMGWGWDYGIGGEFANLNTARSMIAAVGACPSAISKKLSCPGTWNTQKTHPSRWDSKSTTKQLPCRAKREGEHQRGLVLDRSEASVEKPGFLVEKLKTSGVVIDYPHIFYLWYHCLVGAIPIPLKNDGMKVSWDYK